LKPTEPANLNNEQKKTLIKFEIPQDERQRIAKADKIRVGQGADASGFPDTPTKDSRTKSFQNIYRTNVWGQGVNPKSGSGSSIEATKNTRRILSTVFALYNISNVLDAPCGDLTWMPLVWEKNPHVRYIGADIVPELIEEHKAKYSDKEFLVLDLVTDKLPDVDLIFCRDALQHLREADIMKALDNISGSKAKYLLTSTYMRQSKEDNMKDIRTGSWNHRNLLLEPFSLGDPIAIFAEQDPIHKFLGLWKLPLTFDDGRRSKRK